MSCFISAEVRLGRKGRSGISVSAAVTMFCPTIKQLPLSAQRTVKCASAWGQEIKHLLFQGTGWHKHILQEISDVQIVLSEESVYFNIQESMQRSLWKPLISQSNQPDFIASTGYCLQWLKEHDTQMAGWRSEQWNRRWTAEVFLQWLFRKAVSGSSLHSAVFQLVYWFPPVSTWSSSAIWCSVFLIKYKDFLGYSYCEET